MPSGMVIPGSDQYPMDLLRQLFGIGVGPMEGERRLGMRGGQNNATSTQRGDIGDYMGGRRKAYPGEGRPPSNYASATNRLNDMLYMTGGYINPQRNTGDLWRMYHGFA